MLHIPFNGEDCCYLTGEKQLGAGLLLGENNTHQSVVSCDHVGRVNGASDHAHDQIVPVPLQ